MMVTVVQELQRQYLATTQQQSEIPALPLLSLIPTIDLPIDRVFIGCGLLYLVEQVIGPPRGGLTIISHSSVTVSYTAPSRSLMREAATNERAKAREAFPIFIRILRKGIYR